MTIIVFSKNRAMQLDAFLRSYRKFVWPVLNVDIIYAASTEGHVIAYRQVFERHACAFPTRETRFKDDLLSLLPGAGQVVFFVDDQVFIRPWRVEELSGVSLRLAPHLTRCYPTNSDQPSPTFWPFSNGLHAWRWSEGLGDWGYPMTLDGQVFNALEIRQMVEEVEFSSPNTLESALQRFTPRFTNRYGLCYEKSRVVNVPWNVTQSSQAPNRNAGDASVNEMLALWESGHQIALSHLVDALNESCHQEFPLMLESRL